MKIRQFFFPRIAFICSCVEKQDDAFIPDFSDVTTLQLVSNHYNFYYKEAACDFSEYPLYYNNWGWNNTLQKEASIFYLPLNIKSNKATYTFYNDTNKITLTVNYKLVVKDGNIGYTEYYNSKWMTIDTFSIDTIASSPIFKNMYFEQNADFEKDTTAFALFRSSTFK